MSYSLFQWKLLWSFQENSDDMILRSLPCSFTASALVSAAETKAEIALLESSAKNLAAKAPHLEARIKLEQACMRDLPQIFRGNLTVAEAICPNGSLDLIEAVSQDPIHSFPYCKQIARIACTYSKARTQVINQAHHAA